MEFSQANVRPYNLINTKGMGGTRRLLYEIINPCVNLEKCRLNASDKYGIF